MQGAYGGLICIINYASGQSVAEDDFFIITQDGLNITTQLSQELIATEEV